jgi:PBP1b-binding outer membrane lipoprotein LpoB
MMKKGSRIILFIQLTMTLAGCLLLSCSGNPASVTKAETEDTSRPDKLDIGKIKSDIEKISSGANENNPDRASLKTESADVLAATAEMLSDSGISKIGADSQDRSVKQAEEIFKHMRDSVGIAPAALDSVKNASGKLSSLQP